MLTSITTQASRHAGIRPIHRWRLSEPVVVGLVALAAFIVPLFLARGTTFWFDEWKFILGRDHLTIDTIFQPHNDHPAPLLVLFYNALMHIVGLDTYVAYRAVAHAAHVAVALTIYCYVRRLVPFSAALSLFAVLASYGPGWENILWAFQLGWTGSLAFGLVALVLSSYHSRRAYWLIGICLVVSTSFSSLGLLFIFGIAVKWLLTRRPGLLAACLPAALAYAVWFAMFYDFYTVRASERYGFDYSLPVQLMGLPHFATVMWADAFAGAFGLLPWQPPEAQTGPPTPAPWGVALLVLVAAIAVVRVLNHCATVSNASSGGSATQGTRGVRRAWFSKALWWATTRLRIRVRRDDQQATALAVVSILLFFTLLVGVGRAFFDRPSTSRYLYVTVCFIALLTAHAIGGFLHQQPSAVRRGLSTLLLALALFASLANLGLLRRGALYLRAQAAHTRATLYFLDLARPFLPRSFVAEPMFDIRAGAYYRVRDRFGSPVNGTARITSEADGLRAEVDQLLVRSGALLVDPAGGPRTSRASALPTPPATDGSSATFSRPRQEANCTTIVPKTFAPEGSGPPAQTTVEARPGSGLVVWGPKGVHVAAHAFGTRATDVGTIAEETEAIITPRRMALDQAWTVVLSSEGRFKVCRAE